MKISFITTVLNEEETIMLLLDSLFKQSKLPDEIIIVDGGSTDRTLSEVSNYISKNKVLKFQVITREGNRAVGRNEGIKRAKGDIIVLSDAGCILDENWVEEISKPFKDQRVDVVAGYYKGKAETVFQKCLIPYVLVMPDRVDQRNFLPATRSMAIRKKIFWEIGGFPKEYSHNEDYVFAKRLEKAKMNIEFVKEAIVYWVPPKTIKRAFIMFYRFALGDMESGIIRPKVVFIFARYALALVLVLIFLFSKNPTLGKIILLGVLSYLIWAKMKNYHYIKEFRGIFLLPFLQILSDFAVIAGSARGFLQRLTR